MSTTTVNLKLQLVGNLGQQLKRINKDIQRDTRRINDTTKVGVRTQQRMTNEVRNTARNYQRLKSSSVSTTNAIKNGYRSIRNENQRLNSELKKTSNLQKRMTTGMQGIGKGIGGTMNKGSAIAGGAMAAGYVVNSQIQPARTYDEQLARTAATATYGKGMSIAERKLVKIELNDTIKQAVRYGGGTRDEALIASQTLIGSGAYDINSVKQVLGATQRAAFVADASAQDAAAVTLQLRNFGLTGKEVALGQDIAVAGGQLGGFEYNDMARYLSNQLPMAKSAGYGGIDGLKKVVAMNQVAMRTAGNADEAGNNVVNLLQKLNSSEFANSIANNIQTQKGDPLNRKGKLDWATYAQQQKSQGNDQVQAFVGLLERQLAGNSRYQQLKNKASTAKGAEAKELYAQMSQMMAGSNLGNIIADRQALMAALAISTNGDENKRIMGGLDNAGGTVNDFHKLFKGDEWATSMQRQQEQLNINYNLYTKVNGALGSFNTGMTNVMKNHEGLSTAAYGATTALTALAAASVAGSLAGGIGGVGKAGASKGAGGLSKAGGRLATAGGALLSSTGVAVAGAGVAGYGIGTMINKAFIEGNAKLSDAIGGTIATALASMGNENAQQALDQHFNSLINQNQQTVSKQDQMINEQNQSTQIQTQIMNQQTQMTAQNAQLVAMQGQITAQQGSMVALLNTIASKDFSPQINVQSSPTTIVKQISSEAKRGRFNNTVP